MKKKVIIIGGGVSGLTAGILLQEAGFSTEIYEKNAVAGGLCTGWKRKGFMIDNCIHWLTGTREGSALNDLWKQAGVLGEDVELLKKEKFFSAELNGEQLTFWRDLERTRRELLELSPEDAHEINKLIDYTKLAESMSVPVEKPFDAMSILDYMKLGMSMKSMGKVMKEYGGMDIGELAERFAHPLIRLALIDYMPPGYQAYAFLVSYAIITGGNGDIPRGGSFAMAMRMVKKYQELGGTLILNTPVKKILLEGKQAAGIMLSDEKTVNADYVICACDTDIVFHNLLPEEMMPPLLKKLYENRSFYPVMSGFQAAFAVTGDWEVKGTHIFPCKELEIAQSKVLRMSVNCYDYEPDFAPAGKTVLQSNFVQTEQDFEYWRKLYQDKAAYDRKKQELAMEIEKRVVAQYPVLKGNIELLDVWTPVTYASYCGCYRGAYMSFIITKQAKSVTVPGKLKGISNVFLASQWQMGPGGLPTAAAMGKFAAWRILKMSK